MARQFLQILAFGCIGFVTSSAAQQLLVVDVQVSGNSKLPDAAIVSASGLAAGQTVEDKDIGAAVKRLMNTGLFSSISWRYDPKAVAGKQGIAITLQVAEAPRDLPVTLNIRDVDEQDVWREMKRENGLIVDEAIPGSGEATQYYLSGVRAALVKLNHDQDVAVKNRVDYFTHKFGVNIETANLPAITGIKFEGNKKVNSDTLTAALRQATFFGEGYTEAYARRLLAAILVPFYEERGYYKVEFSRVGATQTPNGVTISASVEEGQAWTIGKIDFSGEGLPLEDLKKATRLPEGKVANWKLVEAGAEAANAVLKRDGYIASTVEPARVFNDKTHAIDIVVKIAKGKQYRFGSLELKGVADGDLPKARAMWQLADGAPLDAIYVDDYSRTLMKSFRTIRSISREFRPRGGTNLADVVLTVTPQP